MFHFLHHENSYCIFFIAFISGCIGTFGANQGNLNEVVCYQIHLIIPKVNACFKNVTEIEITLHQPQNNRTTVLDLSYARAIASRNVAKYISEDLQIPHCDFDGRIRRNTKSLAALSICDGLEGIIFNGKETWIIQPLNVSNNSLAGWITLKNSSSSTRSFNCGVKNHEARRNSVQEHSILKKKVDRKNLAQNFVARKSRNAPSSSSTSSEAVSAVEINRSLVQGWIRYIEIYVVVDHNFYDQFNRNEFEIHKKIIAIMNYLNAIMKPLDIVTILVGIKILKSNQIRTRSSNHEILLKEYLPMRLELIKNEISHDCTFFILGLKFPESTAGFAKVNAMCGEQAVALIQHHRKDTEPMTTAKIIGHELGHILGIEHDHGFCQGGSIMNSMVSEPTWSNCSKIYLARNIDHFECLLNIPKLPNNLKTCGNGIVDNIEQCDCGPKSTCTNPCCIPETCQFRKNAVCATGACCNVQTCQPLPTGTLCRASVNECDLPEYCLGSSEFCPKDHFKHNHNVCYDGKGSCFNGLCRSVDKICKSKSPSARLPDERNLRNTKRLTECKEVQCQTHLLIDPHSELISDSGILFYNSLPIIEFNIQNSDGLYCSNNEKTCIEGDCVKVLHETDQSGQCSGNGILNNVGNCHCNLHYAPPNCSMPGFGGSINSGHTRNPQDVYDVSTALFWLFFGIIPIAAIACCVWVNIKLIWDRSYRQKVKKECPTCSNCLDSCCCPCMIWLNRWICSMGYDSKKPKKDLIEECDDTGEPRKTICFVEMDVKPPEAEVKSWGLASHTLFTDLITVTPKNSPKTVRRVRLPSDSPILRSKSVENISAKKVYQHSISKDSGNISDLEENVTMPKQKFKSSMTSLINVFQKFGRQSNVSHDNIPGRASAKQSSSKSQNLRRMVVDPLSVHRPANQPEELSSDVRPNFSRSISIEATTSSRIQKIVSPMNPIGNTLSNPVHNSEQHLHFMDSKKNRKIPIELPVNPPKLSPSTMKSKNENSNVKERMALLPPKKAISGSTVGKIADNKEHLNSQKSTNKFLPKYEEKVKKPLLLPISNSSSENSVKNLTKKFQN